MLSSLLSVHLLKAGGRMWVCRKEGAAVFCQRAEFFLKVRLCLRSAWCWWEGGRGRSELQVKGVKLIKDFASKPHRELIRLSGNLELEARNWKLVTGSSPVEKSAVVSSWESPTGDGDGITSTTNKAKVSESPLWVHQPDCFWFYYQFESLCGCESWREMKLQTASQRRSWDSDEISRPLVSEPTIVSSCPARSWCLQMFFFVLWPLKLNLSLLLARHYKWPAFWEFKVFF